MISDLNSDLKFCLLFTKLTEGDSKAATLKQIIQDDEFDSCYLKPLLKSMCSKFKTNPLTEFITMVHDLDR